MFEVSRQGCLRQSKKPGLVAPAFCRWLQVAVEGCWFLRSQCQLPRCGADLLLRSNPAPCLWQCDGLLSLRLRADNSYRRKKIAAMVMAFAPPTANM